LSNKKRAEISQYILGSGLKGVLTYVPTTQLGRLTSTRGKLMIRRLAESLWSHSFTTVYFSSFSSVWSNTSLIYSNSSLYCCNMANSQSVIRDAFEKLKRSNSEEDAKMFATMKLKDVWAVVREIESTQRKRQLVQNLRRIEPFSRGIEKYTKVIEILCNGTPFMPYAWVGLAPRILRLV